MPLKRSVLSSTYSHLKIGLLASVFTFASSTLSDAQPYLAEIKSFAGTFCPKGWASAEGQILQISQYTALFSLLGDIYGGDGRNTFGLPNLSGRAEVGVGRGPALSPINIGEKGGADSVTLETRHLPAHNHFVANHSHFLDTHSHKASLMASSNPPTTHDPDNATLADWSGRGNVYSRETPTEKMAQDSINFDSFDVALTETSSDKTASTGGNPARPVVVRSPALVNQICICVSGCDFPNRN